MSPAPLPEPTRTNPVKTILSDDGLGIWLCARRLHQGRFVWPKDQASMQISLTRSQFDALVIGLPWARIGAHSAIALV